jgi:hypothetical protein
MNLKEELKEQGRSLNWLAGQLSVTPQTVINWRHSGKCPKVYKEKICNLLGVEDIVL